MKKVLLSIARIIWHVLWLGISTMLAILTLVMLSKAGVMPNLMSPVGSVSIYACLGLIVIDFGSMVMFKAGAELPVGNEYYDRLSRLVNRPSKFFFGSMNPEDNWGDSPRGWLGIMLYGVVLMVTFILLIWHAAILIVFLAGWILSSWWSGLKVGRLVFWPDAIKWLHKATAEKRPRHKRFYHRKHATHHAQGS